MKVSRDANSKLSFISQEWMKTGGKPYFKSTKGCCGFEASGMSGERLDRTFSAHFGGVIVTQAVASL